MMRRYLWTCLLAGLMAWASADRACAQDVRYGSPILPEHREMYERGLAFLLTTQSDNGAWENDCGITGICVMALIASGEDPNFGRYAEPVRNGVRYIIGRQNDRTGFIPSGMYQHGFAMLALADCYGAIDDRLLWQGKEKGRTIGEALELAVRCAVTSQEKNPFGAWRYQADGTDADTSVSGAVLMGLLGARNAGIAVPDTAIDKGLQYFANMTVKGGSVGYAGSMGLGDSNARSSICATCFAVAKRKDMETFAEVRDYVVDLQDGASSQWPCYFRYYVSQALFQSDYQAWQVWTRQNTRELVKVQNENGSLSLGMGGGGGISFQTGMLLLSSALDFTLLPVYER